MLVSASAPGALLDQMVGCAVIVLKRCRDLAHTDPDTAAKLFGLDADEVGRLLELDEPKIKKMASSRLFPFTVCGFWAKPGAGMERLQVKPDLSGSAERGLCDSAISILVLCQRMAERSVGEAAIRFGMEATEVEALRSMSLAELQERTANPHLRLLARPILKDRLSAPSDDVPLAGAVLRTISGVL